MIKAKIRPWKIWLFVILTIALVVLGFVFEKPIEKALNVNNEISIENIDENGANIHFIDIGQGDSTLIELPDDKLFLIDAGPRKSKDKLIEYLDGNIFNDRADKVIDYVVLTHADEDHCGGMPLIYEKYEVRNTYRPTTYTQKEKDKMIADGVKKPEDKISVKDTIIYNQTIQAFEDEAGNVTEFSKKGIEIDCPEFNYNFKFIGPINEYYANYNDVSPFIIFTCNGRKTLFSGDAEKIGEAEMVEDNNLCDVDIFKAGHHGSDTSNSLDLLRKITPEYVVISCGKDNKYNHPKPEAMNNFKAVGVMENRIYRTDINGSVLLNIASLPENAGVFESGKINFVVNVRNGRAYIEMEYILVSTIALLFIILFVAYHPRRKNTKQRDKIREINKNDR